MALPTPNRWSVHIAVSIAFTSTRVSHSQLDSNGVERKPYVDSGTFMPIIVMQCIRGRAIGTVLATVGYVRIVKSKATFLLETITLNRFAHATLVLSLAILCTSGIVSAAPLTWSLSGVTFNDGATASGNFDYDASTNTYTLGTITVAAGVLPAATFDASNSYEGSLSQGAHFVMFDLSRYIQLKFASSLTNAGGTVSLLTGVNSYDCLNCSPYRLVTAGSVSAVESTGAVPEPSTMAFMLTAVGLAGVSRYYRRGRV